MQQFIKQVSACLSAFLLCFAAVSAESERKSTESQAAPVNTSSNQQGVVVLESTISGSQEQPKVLYIVPWQGPENPPALQQWIDGQAAVSVLAPLERPVLQRQLAIYQMNKNQQPAVASSAATDN